MSLPPIIIEDLVRRTLLEDLGHMVAKQCLAVVVGTGGLAIRGGVASVGRLAWRHGRARSLESPYGAQRDHAATHAEATVHRNG